jgi:hypothetical protein
MTTGGVISGSMRLFVSLAIGFSLAIVTLRAMENFAIHPDRNPRYALRIV